MPDEADADGRDVVYVLGLVTWRSIEREGLQWAHARLLHALRVSGRVHRLLVVDPWRSVAVLARRVTDRGPTRLPTDSRVHHYGPLRLRRREATSIDAVERSYVAWDRRVEHAAARAGLRKPVVIVNDPLVAGFAQLRWARRVTLYATDDFSALPALGPWSVAISEAYRRIAAAGRPVCAVSETLLERIGATGPAVVVPNGVDPGLWTAPADAPPWFAELPRPRLLYTGTLDTRIDTELVASTANAFPQGTVVLIGGFADEEHLAPLRAHPNVVIHGHVEPAELAAVTHAADVGLVPHVRNRLTRAMSPLKVYEYLGAGLPVASVDLPPLRGLGSRVVLADETHGFVQGVRGALDLGRASEDERRGFIEANSWSRRHDDIIDFALTSRGT